MSSSSKASRRKKSFQESDRCEKVLVLIYKLRNEVYGIVAEYAEARVVYRFYGLYNSVEQKTDKTPRSTTILGARLVDKQMSKEFSEILEGVIPLQIVLDMASTGRHPSPKLLYSIRNFPYFSNLQNIEVQLGIDRSSLTLFSLVEWAHAFTMERGLADRESEESEDEEFVAIGRNGIEGAKPAHLQLFGAPRRRSSKVGIRLKA
ncbi:uncharacterized protein LTR77_007739 [Saxophila tyrrhenica]|uniref:Uncharacterized protein n=1 Tax=Saxophila tyrrhenica TaxID=1690608 RepID=A0AAV9P3F8_9PEZI|nr:hypothetical protein LTR77_007739 [Saxophila tyrrhenica]